ncbi:hypothetical protein [Cohnella panacarvi]|uniref:hypothetical protein n=1 Tax=Cohnella panacarvi TaxID=400776 RepID=UPI0004799198|nr:hypothetical protein [Cohnella panacarvi]
MKRAERPKLRIGGHFFEVEGKLVEIDPMKTNLPSQCKLIWAEAMTGNKYSLVPKVESSSR